MCMRETRHAIVRGTRTEGEWKRKAQSLEKAMVLFARLPMSFCFEEILNFFDRLQELQQSKQLAKEMNQVD